MLTDEMGKMLLWEERTWVREEESENKWSHINLPQGLVFLG